MNSKNQIAPYQPSAIGRTVRRAPSVRTSVHLSVAIRARQWFAARRNAASAERLSAKPLAVAGATDADGASHLLSPSVRRWGYLSLHPREIPLTTVRELGGLGGRW